MWGFGRNQKLHCGFTGLTSGTLLGVVFISRQQIIFCIESLKSLRFSHRTTDEQLGRIVLFNLSLDTRPRVAPTERMSTVFPVFSQKPSPETKYKQRLYAA